jgi:membrane protease YdiL (CAAX protease family)
MKDFLLALTAYVYVAVPAAALLLAIRVQALRSWAQLLPMQRLRPVYIPGLATFVGFLISYVIPFVAGLTLLHILDRAGFFEGLRPEPPVDRKQLHALMLASPLWLPATLGLLLLVVRFHWGLRASHFGLTRARPSANVALGLVAFLILTPLIYSIYALLVLVLGQTGEYPQLDLVKQGFPDWEWVFLVLTTALAVPVLEEVVFRGLVMNWLRRTWLTGHATLMFLTLFIAGLGPRNEGLAWHESPATFGALLVIAYAGLLAWLRRSYLPDGSQPLRWNLPAEVLPDEPEEGEVPTARPITDEVAWQRWQHVNALLAVFGQAMLFAVLHQDKWPVPIVMFGLGLALGWLAYRTQSLLPCVVVHVLFNAVGCLALYWMTAAPVDTNGKAATVTQRPAAVGSASNSVPGAWAARRR